MKKGLNLLLYLLFGLFSLSGCEKDPDVIDAELYQTLIAELTILNQMDEELLDGTTKEEKREQIFEHYGVTEEMFARSHDYYQSDLDAQMNRVQNIQNQLRAERDSVQAAERRYREKNNEEPDTLQGRMINRD